MTPTLLFNLCSLVLSLLPPLHFSCSLSVLTVTDEFTGLLTGIALSLHIQLGRSDIAPPYAKL